MVELEFTHYGWLDVPEQSLLPNCNAEFHWFFDGSVFHFWQLKLLKILCLREFNRKINKKILLLNDEFLGGVFNAKFIGWTFYVLIGDFSMDGLVADNAYNHKL